MGTKFKFKSVTLHLNNDSENEYDTGLSNNNAVHKSQALEGLPSSSTCAVSTEKKPRKELDEKQMTEFHKINDP
jgi:hypothetical protein